MTGRGNGGGWALRRRGIGEQRVGRLEGAVDMQEAEAGAEMVDDAMDEQTLVYWLNSLPIRSALLVSEIRDLDDGDTIIEVVAHLFPEVQDDGPLDLHVALDALASGIGGLPPPFTDVRVAYANILGGGQYALCWIAAVLRFAAGDGPALGFTGSSQFQSFVDMGAKMDRIGSPRQEWGMANGSPARTDLPEARETANDIGHIGEDTDELCVDPRDTLLPTMLPSFDEVWRKSDGQWRPAASSGAAEAASGADAPHGTDSARQDADVNNGKVPGDPTDEDAMRHGQYTTYEKRVDLSARPAQHARAWNSSTYIEVGAGIAAPAVAVPNKQLLLANSQTSSQKRESEPPLWACRGTLTDRGLLVGTLCDPAPGSHIHRAGVDQQHDRKIDAAVEARKRARKSPSPKRRAKSSPSVQPSSVVRRNRRDIDQERKTDHKVVDEKPVELHPRVGKVVKWLQTMPLDIGPLGKLGLENPPAARLVTMRRDALRKAFGPGRLLCQLVNVLEETHVCTSTKSHRVNVNRALAMLRLRPSMPIEHLWATDELLDGDADVTFGLLEHIRTSYACSGRSSSGTSRVDTRASVARRNTAAVEEIRSPVRSTHASSGSDDLVEPGPTLDASGHAHAAHAGLSTHWAPLLPVEMRSLQVAQQHENCLANEATVRHRLRKLGFDIPSRARLASSNPGLLQDPLRNGTLLCTLVELLDPRCKLKGVAEAPDTVDAAVGNVKIAFAELRRLSSRNEAWFSSEIAEDIVRGRQDLLWGLLACVTGPVDADGEDRQAASPNSSRGSSNDAVTTAAAAGWRVRPYTVAQTRLLEISLLQWIQSLGLLLSPPNAVVRWSVDEAVDRMLRECSDGTLLCDLTAEICSESIPGVTRRPRIAAAKHGNIAKAFEVLRRRKVVGTEHLHSEEDVRTCVRGAVLGLLEAMHRAYDGAPRSKQELGKAGAYEPYLGKRGMRGLEEYAKTLEATARVDSPERQQHEIARRSTTPTKPPRNHGQTKPGKTNTNRGDTSLPRRDENSKSRLPSALKIRGPAPSLIPVPASSPITSNVSSPRMSPREWDSTTRRRRRQQVATTGPLRVQLAAAASASRSGSDDVPVAVACETEDTNRIKVIHCNDTWIPVAPS